MQNTTQIRLTEALAAGSDTVYGRPGVEHTFEYGNSGGPGTRTRAESASPWVTGDGRPGAGTPAPGKARVMEAVAHLKQQHTALSGTKPHLLLDGFERASLALGCARHVAASLTSGLVDLSPDERLAVVDTFAQCDEGAPYEDVLRLTSVLLRHYVSDFIDNIWEAEEGLLPSDTHWSMPVWRMSNRRYVCDLITFMTPWDPESAVSKHVAVAIDHADAIFGPQFYGVRVLPVLSPYLARWYFPDHSWLPLSEAMTLV